MYDAEELIKVLNQKPFTPLVLLVSTGETFAISHPEQAIVTSTDGVIITSPSKRPGRHDWHLIGLDHVVGVQVCEAAN